MSGIIYKSFKSLLSLVVVSSLPNMVHSVPTTRGSASEEGEVASAIEDTCGVLGRLALEPATANQPG